MKERRSIVVFSSALILFACGSAINNSIFNNYLSDVFNLNAGQRGWLEVPRELPGLLVTLAIGIFFFMSEIRFLAAACLVAAAGITGLAVLSPGISSMVWWVFVWSMGVHIQMVLMERVALDIGLAKGVGRRLGRMNGLRSLGMIVGALFVAVFARPLGIGYSGMFICAACVMAVAALMYFILSSFRDGKRVQRAAFVLKKRYSRYYLLSALFGIRKQIFITFAPWFLVRILALRPEDIARILLVSAAIGIVVKPWLGGLIDRFGERNILVADGLLIAGLCLGYVIFPLVFSGMLLIILCAVFYIIDETLFTLRTARTIWLTKIAETPGDVTGSMSVSVSIDHILSMTVSWMAGIAWILFGYQVVFMFCSVIALSMTIVSAGIRTENNSS